MLRGEKESTQVQSQMRHFPLEKGNTVMPLGRLPSPRLRPTGSRTALFCLFHDTIFVLSGFQLLMYDFFYLLVNALDAILLPLYTKPRMIFTPL